MKALLVGGVLHGTVTSVIGTPREFIIPSDYYIPNKSNHERYRYVFVGETLPTRSGDRTAIFADPSTKKLKIREACREERLDEIKQTLLVTVHGWAR